MSQPKAKQAQQTRKSLFKDNQALVQTVLRLRDQLDHVNTEKFKDRGNEFDYSVPDLKSMEELKKYMRDGFFGTNYADRKKAFMTYKINFDVSDPDLVIVINQLEAEIQKEETDKFLLERDFHVSKVREQEEEIKKKLIEESK